MLGANPVAETINGFLNFVRIMIIKQRYVCTLLLARRRELVLSRALGPCPRTK